MICLLTCQESSENVICHLRCHIYYRVTPVWHGKGSGDHGRPWTKASRTETSCGRVCGTPPPPQQCTQHNSRQRKIFNKFRKRCVNDSFRILLASKTGAFDGTSQIEKNQAARSSHHHHAQHPFHPSKHKDHDSVIHLGRIYFAKGGGGSQIWSAALAG